MLAEAEMTAIDRGHWPLCQRIHREMTRDAIAVIIVGGLATGVTGANLGALLIFHHALFPTLLSIPIVGTEFVGAAIVHWRHRRRMRELRAWRNRIDRVSDVWHAL